MRLAFWGSKAHMNAELPELYKVLHYSGACLGRIAKTYKSATDARRKLTIWACTSETAASRKRNATS